MTMSLSAVAVAEISKLKAWQHATNELWQLKLSIRQVRCQSTYDVDESPRRRLED